VITEAINNPQAIK
jgi:exportin-1